MAIRVVAAEDSFLAREGIVSILDDIEDVELVEMSGDLDELRDAVERTSPDIVLTDIRMPPTNTDEGIRFAAELREKHPDVGVVVLSQHAEPRYAIALLTAGSDRRAYLLKERLHDKSELSRALHDVAAGRSLVDSRVVDKLVSARQRSDSALDEADSARARDPRPDRRGPQQRLDRLEARDHEARGRAAHQRDLPEARPRQGGGRQPAREGRAPLSRRRGALAGEECLEAAEHLGAVLGHGQLEARGDFVEERGDVRLHRARGYTRPKRSRSSPWRRPRSLTVSELRPSFSSTVLTTHAPARMTSARFGCRPRISRRASEVRAR